MYKNRLVVDVDVDVVVWIGTILDRKDRKSTVSQVVCIKTAVKIVPRVRAYTDYRKSFT